MKQFKFSEEQIIND